MRRIYTNSASRDGWFTQNLKLANFVKWNSVANLPGKKTRPIMSAEDRRTRLIIDEPIKRKLKFISLHSYFSFCLSCFSIVCWQVYWRVCPRVSLFVYTRPYSSLPTFQCLWVWRLTWSPYIQFDVYPFTQTTKPISFIPFFISFIPR